MIPLFRIENVEAPREPMHRVMNRPGQRPASVTVDRFWKRSDQRSQYGT